MATMRDYMRNKAAPMEWDATEWYVKNCLQTKQLANKCTGTIRKNTTLSTNANEFVTKRPGYLKQAVDQLVKTDEKLLGLCDNYAEHDEDIKDVEIAATIIIKECMRSIDAKVMRSELEKNYELCTNYAFFYGMLLISTLDIGKLDEDDCGDTSFKLDIAKLVEKFIIQNVLLSSRYNWLKSLEN